MLLNDGTNTVVGSWLVRCLVMVGDGGRGDFLQQ